ncbi:MAG: hypothetical protein GVY06_12045 [Alphaproteobacteria bacterium]|jgi:hypothetical protein|nr:hypothetical protein [Alphaproteobacteria bacterium]
MARRLDHLARTPVLVGSFIVFLVSGALFGVFMPAAGGDLLDMQMNGKAAQSLLAAMDSGERGAHVWITAVLDSVYPLAYGAVLAGLAWRLGGRVLLVVPALVAMLADFAENGVQIAALNGAAGLLAVKDIITPLKFGALALAALIAIVLILAAVLRRLTGRG